LFAENKEKLIINTLSSLRDLENTNSFTSDQIEQEFHTLRRLMASKVGYKAFTNLPRLREVVGKKILKALRKEEDSVTYAAIEFLNSLMQVETRFFKFF
jgi:DnaJ family protein C protein 13